MITRCDTVSIEEHTLSCTIVIIVVKLGIGYLFAITSVIVACIIVLDVQRGRSVLDIVSVDESINSLKRLLFKSVRGIYVCNSSLPWPLPVFLSCKLHVCLPGFPCPLWPLSVRFRSNVAGFPRFLFRCVLRFSNFDVACTAFVSNHNVLSVYLPSQVIGFELLLVQFLFFHHWRFLQ